MNHSGELPDGFPIELAEGAELKPSRPLAIVGSHPDTRENAPYDDDNFDIWLFNEAPQKPEVYRRWTASFQMHLPEVYASEHNWVNQDHWNWLQQDHGERTIWMQDFDERVPNSKKYPLDEVLKLVPYKYLRSTPAQALALAIHLGYKEIWLYGSELSSNTEYTYQAINYAFWIGFAHGLGIDLHMECWQSEFNQPIYGYEGETQIPREFFELRINDLKTISRQEAKAMMKIQNKLDEAMLKSDFEKVGSLSLNLESMAVKAGESAAALDEALRYYSRTEPISRQEYERVSAQAQIDGEDAKAKMNHAAGKCEYVWNAWRQSGQLAALEQLRLFIREKTEHALETGKHLGIFNENYQYQQKYDRLVVAAGGIRAVHQAQGGEV